MPEWCCKVIVSIRHPYSYMSCFSVVTMFPNMEKDCAIEQDPVSSTNESSEEEKLKYLLARHVNVVVVNSSSHFGVRRIFFWTKFCLDRVAVVGLLAHIC